MRKKHGGGVVQPALGSRPESVNAGLRLSHHWYRRQHIHRQKPYHISPLRLPLRFGLIGWTACASHSFLFWCYLSPSLTSFLPSLLLAHQTPVHSVPLFLHPSLAQKPQENRPMPSTTLTTSTSTLTYPSQPFVDIPFPLYPSCVCSTEGFTTVVGRRCRMLGV